MCGLVCLYVCRVRIRYLVYYSRIILYLPYIICDVFQKNSFLLPTVLSSHPVILSKNDAQRKGKKNNNSNGGGGGLHVQKHKADVEYITWILRVLLCCVICISYSNLALAAIAFCLVS